MSFARSVGYLYSEQRLPLIPTPWLQTGFHRAARFPPATIRREEAHAKYAPAGLAKLVGQLIHKICG
jgi:hypothetical protein